MKAYTDLKQSKKLAEILPIKSADMYYLYDEKMEMYDDYPRLITDTDELWDDDTPCWSLAALLELLDYPQLSKDKLGGGKAGWMVSVYSDNCRYDSRWCDNSVDACYEMIIKLHEQKLL